MLLIQTECGHWNEPLKTAFAFKGNALTTLWQTAVQIQTEKNTAIGLGVQSVLWSDPAVFRRYGEEEGNRLMFQVTEYAQKLLCGEQIPIPFAWIDQFFDPIYEYAKKMTGMPELSKTFVWNALVPIDFALWQLWGKENGTQNFDVISLFDGQRQTKMANIPLITYRTTEEEAVRLAQNCSPLLKIKIGSDPNGNGSVEEMLEWDQKRLLEIHRAVRNVPTEYTESGKILYYLDANGRYDKKDTLLRLLDFADRHGILERTVLLEEPFAEKNAVEVGDLPVCVAADESVHGMEELEERVRLGYRALTLKPIAKGLSLSVKMAETARKHGMVCFCADLTVNPMMVSWNQCAAARLSRLPGMKVGVLESNGSQNYVNWEQMAKQHPLYGSGFVSPERGVYELDEHFYRTDGGIWEIPEYCREFFKMQENG